MASVAGRVSFVNGDPHGVRAEEETRRQLNFLIIGAGSRGNAYASALQQCRREIPNRISAIAEPIELKRRALQQQFVHSSEDVRLFDTWKHFSEYEVARQKERARNEPVPEGVDGVFVCTLDDTHAEIVTSLALLGLHIMCEKPLATTLSDCLTIYRCLQPPGTHSPPTVFSIGHVLRYSPHNMLLRKLLLEDHVIGDILSIEHTEPVGWWHFAHSYVR